MSDRTSRRSRDEEDDRGSRSRGRDRDDDRSSRRSRDDDRGSRSARGRDRDDDRGGRSSRSGYTYQPRSREDVDKRASGSGDWDRVLVDDIKMFKVNDGDNMVRFLPPTWKGAKHYGHDVYVHYGVGPDRATYLCLHKMKGEPCPICEERREAMDRGDEDYAKELEPKQRVLVYIVDRDHEKEGVQAWMMPWTLDRDINSISVDKRSGEVLPIDHPDDGYDVSFNKAGAKDRTKYSAPQIDRRPSPLGKDAWLEFAQDHPLPEILNYYDYDHIARAFGGGGGHRSKRDRDDDRDDRGRGRGRDDDREEGRSRGRDRDDDRGSRGRGREEAKPKHDRADILKMEGQDLDDLIDEMKLDLDPNDYDSDEELAEAICEELGLEDEPAPRSRRRPDDAEDDTRAALNKMRERRRGD